MFISRKEAKRSFVMSDIHGCALTFQMLLKQIDFSKEDQLFLLGDYIDRGPRSKQVIDHIWYLQEEGYTVHCLTGNHERMLLDFYHSYAGGPKDHPLNHHHTETLISFGTHLVKEVPDDYLAWMNELPYYFETEGFILVHAGFNFSIPNPLKDKNAMIWARYWQKNINHRWLADRVIIHGHTPVKRHEIKGQAEELHLIPALNIDCGAVLESLGRGALCTVELNTMALIFQHRID